MSRIPNISSFHPILREAWKQAAIEPKTIPVKSRQEATRLRHRLYKLRLAMQEANDPFYQSAQHVTLTIIPWLEGYAILMEPSDSTFVDTLTKAGITLPEENLSSLLSELDQLEQLEKDKP